MTPYQKIKKQIVLNAKSKGLISAKSELSLEEVDELYLLLEDLDYLADLKEEFRCSGQDTGILSDTFLRDFANKEVAVQVYDNSWVGWTFWTKIGNHGNAPDIDWMNDAYEVSCTESQKIITIRTFTK